MELSRDFRIGLIAMVLALLFHALLLVTRLPSLLNLKKTHPARVQIHQVDPKQLEALRKQWKQKEQNLLLSQKDAPRAQEAPKDARYISDKNVRVEKEMRARNTAPLPHPGAPAAEAPAPQKASSPAPKLSQLGVPLQLQKKASPQPSKKTAKSNRTESQPTPGGEQTLADSQLPLGSQNLLNAQESVYYSFYSRIYEAISPVWHSRIHQASPNQRVLPGSYTTQLDVVFDRNGTIKAVYPVMSSHVNEFDQAAILAWKTVGPFPNPPKGLLNESGEVHTGWTFTVQINNTYNYQTLPPEKVY